MTNLLLTRIADAWGLGRPGRLFQVGLPGLISTSLELISIENEDWVKVMYDCLLSEGLEGGGGNYYILGFQVALLIF